MAKLERHMDVPKERVLARPSAYWRLGDSLSTSRSASPEARTTC